MGVVLFLQLNVDRVSLLMFHNLQAAASDVPAMGGYASFNFVLIPSLDVNVGVMCFDTQVRLAGEVVDLRPIVGVSKSGEGCEGENRNDQRQATFSHGGIFPASEHGQSRWSDV